MELIELFSLQKELDAFIENSRDIHRDVFIEKGLALTIELAELANETRCFKYWSSKGPSEREVLLEEFVDSIHFLLSLGNEKGYKIDRWPDVQQEVDLTKWFLKTQEVILSFIHNPEVDKYSQVWQYYSVLAYNLGFTFEDILAGYITKNEKNYERQRTGY
ncbi:dUTP diphosphatase [Ureibacillus sp. MALMAid1270]|uniref:dUTP diphosphatase n=1 Tax=Ureibacillus sp. MALMAid1270 TaxID=3411629 RepID=UPI003BA51C75